MTQTEEDARQGERSRDVYRERIRDKLETMSKEELIDMAVDVAEAIDSIAGTLAEMPHDMGEDRSHAWIYGIVLGWDEAASIVARRHEWHAYTVDRMVRYNVGVEKLINDTRGPRV